jgi:hypothetical protein
MRIQFMLTVTLLAAICSGLPGTARGTDGAALSPMRLMDRLQERIAGCRDYQYDVACYERLGGKEERRSYHLYVKDNRMVRLKVTSGRGKGSEAALDAEGQLRGRKGGILKIFDEPLKPDDHRVRSLRGMPFWDAAAHNYLKALRERMTRPGVNCSVEPATDPPDGLRLVVHLPDGNWEQYWVETPQMRVVRGEVYESGQLIERYVISNIRENVGLTDDFFTF